MMKQCKDRYNEYKLWTIQDSPACSIRRDTYSRDIRGDHKCPRLQGKGLCVTNNTNFWCYYAHDLDEAKQYTNWSGNE